MHLFVYKSLLTRVGDLEEDILHDIAAVLSLEFKLLSVKVDIVEPPCRCGQHSRHATLTLHDLQTQVHSLFTGITGSPTLSAHSVGAVSISTHALAVNPCLGDGVTRLRLAKTEHLADNSGRSHLDQDNVVQTNLVERVLQGHAALNLVGLDHGLEDVLYGKDLSVANVSAVAVGSAHPICNRKDSAEVVTGVTPLGGEPAVIKVEPSDHGADVESTEHGIELVGCSRDLCAIGNSGSGDNGTEQLGAVRELEGLETAAQSIEQDVSGSVDL
jgi:hypothetical protein